MVEPPADRASVDPLTRLVGDPGRFEREHWGRRPLLSRQAWPQRPPLTVEDVDHLVTSSGLRWPGFRLVERGRTVPASACTRSGRIGGQRVDDLVDAGRTLERFRQGATLVLQGLHRSHPPVAELCEQLEEALGHPVQANAYLTPPGSRGLNVHHDTHDVFAIQTHGRKHWVVHEPAVAVPLASQPWSADEHRPGPEVLDVDLGPGDALYLPRGAPHAAETLDEVSLHLTVGVRVVTWHDVLGRAVRRLGEREASMREALPLGYGRDPEALAEAVASRLSEAADGLVEESAGALVGELLAERRRARRPRLRGHLLELLELDGIHDGTCVRRRAGVEPGLRHEQDAVVLGLPDRDLRLPAAAEPALTALLDGRRHRVGELCHLLDEDGRLVLVRRLVREGALCLDGSVRG